MTPQTYRVTALMQHFAENQAALNAARMGQAGAPSHVLGRAIIIQELSKMLPDAFPAGSEGGRALPAVWANQAEFQARIQALQSAATGLVEAARGGDAAQVQTAAGALQQSCAACHMAFRGPAPPPPPSN